MGAGESALRGDSASGSPASLGGRSPFGGCAGVFLDQHTPQGPARLMFRSGHRGVDVPVWAPGSCFLLAGPSTFRPARRSIPARAGCLCSNRLPGGEFRQVCVRSSPHRLQRSGTPTACTTGSVPPQSGGFLGQCPESRRGAALRGPARRSRMPSQALLAFVGRCSALAVVEVSRSQRCCVHRLVPVRCSASVGCMARRERAARCRDFRSALSLPCSDGGSGASSRDVLRSPMIGSPTKALLLLCRSKVFKPVERRQPAHAGRDSLLDLCQSSGCPAGSGRVYSGGCSPCRVLEPLAKSVFGRVFA